jgi:translocator protein
VTAAAASAWKPVLLALLGAVLASAPSALATDIGPRYYGLEKPAWQPPDWLFGPVWTTIFALTALAAVIGWRRAPDRGSRRRMALLFGVNLLLNVGWSLIFFRLQRPDLALLEVTLLWASIATLMVILWPYARVASLLLLPYLAWVSFASMVNLAVVRLNAPFPGL